MEMLTSSQKTQVCEHSSTPVSVPKWGAGTQFLSLLFMIFIEEMLNFPIEDEDFTLSTYTA